MTREEIRVGGNEEATRAKGEAMKAGDEDSTSGEAQHLRTEIIGGVLMISVGIDTLRIAIEASPYLDRTQLSRKITDTRIFAEELLLELNAEDEEGGTAIHALFDQAAERAIQNGCEGVEHDDE